MGFGGLTSIAGMGLGAYGNSQNERAAYQHAEEYRSALSRYLGRQRGFNNDLTSQLDAIGGQRADALTGLLGHLSSGERYAAANDAANQARQNIGLSLQQTAMPGLFNNYTTTHSGATNGTLRRQNDKTHQMLGGAIGYAATGRGIQGMQQYDRGLFDRLGTQYTTYGRQAGESQADTSLRQAELDRVWQALSARYGQPAPTPGSNAMLLGQALQLGGGYASSVQANQPAYSAPATSTGGAQSGGYSTQSNVPEGYTYSSNQTQLQD